MKISIPLLCALLVAGFIPYARGQGAVTVKGGGAGYNVPRHADLPYAGYAAAGAFVGLTDAEIMENATGYDDLLVAHWVPFTPDVKVGRDGTEIDPFIFPPLPDYGLFGFNYANALAADSPLRGKPVYVWIRWVDPYEEGPGFPRHVIHKTRDVFPADGSDATITVNIDPVDPRLLAGVVWQPGAGWPANTVTWKTPVEYPAPIYDNWAFAWFGTTDAAAEALPEADPDGDGQTNAEEWKTATDPGNGASRFELRLTKPPTATIYSFEWPTRPGYFYLLVRSDTPDVPRPATRPSNAEMASFSEMTQTVTVPADARRRFFVVHYWEK
jgi:hypothetical protein